MEEKVLEILKRVFNDLSLDASCSQATCKTWDSMNQLNLVVELEMEFGVSLEPEEIARMTNYMEVVQILKSKL